ncbi:PGF-CTERM sorting domain-containing protein [Halorarius halobius]|uniref:PGF-CTERM sorting domain-containing protein n=1 Tax=Halorarius halobius TaxID=2962671 RepID=UPI0025775D28|nr:PGF-CTERM sorting domain-containing protein [Halorarius halobius]
MRVRTVLVLAFVGVLLVPAGASGFAADAQFSIEITDDIDTPSRNVDIEGETFTVSSVAQRSPGEELAVPVDAPDSSIQYEVYLYNEDFEIVDTKAMQGDGTARFQTGSYAAGSYLAAVYYDGDVDALHPVVIAGYTTSLSIDSSVESGESTTATVEVQAGSESLPPHRVQVVIGSDSKSIRTDATKQSTGTYTATVDVDLSPGSYFAYGVVRGSSETENGRDVVLSVSPGQDLTVTEASTSTPTESPSDGGGTGGGGTGGDGPAGGTGGGGTDGGTANATATPTVTATPNATVSPTASPTVSPTASPTVSATPTATPTASPSPTDDGVVTPSSPTATPSSTPTPTGQPGFGLVAALVAILALAAVAHRR